MIEMQRGDARCLSIINHQSSISNSSAPGGNRTHIAPRGGCFTGSLAAHRASEGVARFHGSSTGGIRTHIHRGLSSAAMPVCAPCHFARAPGGSRTHPSAIPRRQAATTSQGHSYTPRITFDANLIQSAQWESNPHFRHGKATGSRYIMGALFVILTEHPAGLAPATPPWEGSMLLLHHGRTHTVEAVGIEPT